MCVSIFPFFTLSLSVFLAFLRWLLKLETIFCLRAAAPSYPFLYLHRAQLETLSQYFLRFPVPVSTLSFFLLKLYQMCKY
jgi:hypothetical protein